MSRQCLQILGSNLSTLEQQLDKSKNEQLALQMEIRTLTRERDTAKQQLQAVERRLQTRTAVLTRERDNARSQLHTTQQRKQAQVTRLRVIYHALSTTAAMFARPHGNDPADLVESNPYGDVASDWSEAVVNQLKALFQRQPIWTIMTDGLDGDENEVLVLGHYNGSDNSPWYIKGMNGKRYTPHSVVLYFDPQE